MSFSSIDPDTDLKKNVILHFFQNEMLDIILILSFILKLNSYSILSDSLACYSAYPYTGVVKNILLLLFAVHFLTVWITLMGSIKIGFLYKALPWMGLVYIGTYELWHRKPVGEMSFELGLLIATCCCFLLLFRLLNLVIRLFKQKSVQHCEDKMMEEISFISQLRKGGIIPWRGVKLVIVCIVNGALMIGNQELVLESNCTISVSVGMLVLITGLLYFGMFYVLHNFEELEGYGEVLPPPPPVTPLPPPVHVINVET